jgi:hypothetical protein
MSGFCGQCGTPRPDGAKFCMTCGAQLYELRACPTCGQNWPEGMPPPEGQIVTESVVTEAVTTGQVPVATPAQAVEGMYSTDTGTVYFDGAQAWVAVDRGGFYMPDMSQPVPYFNPAALGVSLISEHSAQSSERPTGPSLGPDYMPGRDCGNCGFELAGNDGPCAYCGSSNTGASFDPASMN